MPTAELTSQIWNYLVIKDPLRKSDVVFVFGSVDLDVPKKAAELFNKGLSPLILVSGKLGHLTKGSFKKTEAETFADELIKLGVPKNKLLIEKEALHTSQNIKFGMKLLKQKGIKVNRAILVTIPFLSRRCKETFSKLFPNLDLISCPAYTDLEIFLKKRPDTDSIRLQEEIDRLEEYAKREF